MNIGIACSKDYLFLHKTMLRSLVENNRKCKDQIIVYLLNSDLNSSEIDKFSTWCNSIGLNLKYIFVDSNIFPDDICFSKSAVNSIAAYYRLLFPFLVPNDVDRLLYLDGDMIINGTIEDLYEIDFMDNLIAAAPDVFCFSGFEKVNGRIGLPKDYVYFNSGMLVFNISALRNEFSLNDVFQCARNIQDNMLMGDQDILNCLCKNRVMYVPMLKYNFQVIWQTTNADEAFLLIHDTRIIHFLYKRKPTNYLYANDLKKLFWKYARMNGCYGKFFVFFIINSIFTALWSIYVRVKHLEKDCAIDYLAFEKLGAIERTGKNNEC